MSVLTYADHWNLVRATGDELKQLERKLSARQSDSVDHIIERTNLSPLLKDFHGYKGSAAKRREAVLRVHDGIKSVQGYLAENKLTGAERTALYQVRLRVTAAQKTEWRLCEAGSYEDCLLRREQGASTEDTPHVAEVLERGKHNEILISSPADMMILVKSLGFNQYRETQPAMHKRLWGTLLEATRHYPLGASDREEVARIEREVARWA